MAGSGVGSGAGSEAGSRVGSETGSGAGSETGSGAGSMAGIGVGSGAGSGARDTVMDQELVSVKYIAGVGNKSARIVFVGEAPGRWEEQLGEPFVGKSGQLLNKWIIYLGLKRPDVYITNVVKVRPQNNRIPTDEEVKSWLPLLHTELDEVTPTYYITLGKTAEKALKEYLGYENVISLYHPAFVLRKPSAEAVILQRLDALKEKLQ